MVAIAAFVFLCTAAYGTSIPRGPLSAKKLTEAQEKVADDLAQAPDYSIVAFNDSTIGLLCPRRRSIPNGRFFRQTVAPLGKPCSAAQELHVDEIVRAGAVNVVPPSDRRYKDALVSVAHTMANDDKWKEQERLVEPRPR